MCSKSFTFFPSIPFSNLDPIPLHCSCHCNFFILLLLLFSYVFSFFTANALKQCAFSFVSFKFSYLIFSQWCQMVRWNYETLKSVEFISNLSLVSISFPPTTWPMLLTFCFPLYFLFLSLPRYQAHVLMYIIILIIVIIIIIVVVVVVIIIIIPSCTRHSSCQLLL